MEGVQAWTMPGETHVFTSTSNLNFEIKAGPRVRPRVIFLVPVSRLNLRVNAEKSTLNI